jgi:hypothetical protein
VSAAGGIDGVNEFYAISMSEAATQTEMAPHDSETELVGSHLRDAYVRVTGVQGFTEEDADEHGAAYGAAGTFDCADGALGGDVDASESDGTVAADSEVAVTTYNGMTAGDSCRPRWADIVSDDDPTVDNPWLNRLETAHSDISYRPDGAVEPRAEAAAMLFTDSTIDFAVLCNHVHGDVVGVDGYLLDGAAASSTAEASDGRLMCGVILGGGIDTFPESRVVSQDGASFQATADIPPVADLKGTTIDQQYQYGLREVAQDDGCSQTDLSFPLHDWCCQVPGGSDELIVAGFDAWAREELHSHAICRQSVEGILGVGGGPILPDAPPFMLMLCSVWIWMVKGCAQPSTVPRGI